MRVRNREHSIEGLMQMTPCIIKNTTAADIEPYSWLVLGGNVDVSNQDSGLMSTDIAINVSKFPPAGKPPAVCSSGPIRIPAGMSAPGYMGPMMPIAYSGGIGDRISPKPDTFTGELDPSGDWVVQVANGSVSVIMHSPLGGEAGEDAPRVQFRSVQDMSDRSMTVEVVSVFGNAINPETNTPLAVGDELVVHDVQNKWPDALENATGMAYYQQPVEDNLETLDVDEQREDFWQIEDCTLPINRIKCYINQCLKKTNTGGPITVFFKCDESLNPTADGAETPWKLSSYPNVDVPPEFVSDTGGGDGSQFLYTMSLEVTNPFGKDAVSTSTSGSGSGGSSFYKQVELVRVVNQGTSDPGNTVLDKANPYSGSVEWQVVDVEEQIARHVKGTISGTNPNAAVPVSWIDGGNPMASGCPPEFEWFCEKLECNNRTACFWATYDPENHVYWITATDYAILGVPVKVTLNPNLRIETASNGDKSLCVDVFDFYTCAIEDVGDSCVPLYECP